MTQIKKLGVVGCGQMGAGIAEVAVLSGIETVTREINQELLDRGRARIESSVERSVGKQRVTEQEAEAALGRLSGSTDLDALSDCDLVIEAVVEDVAIKQPPALHRLRPGRSARLGALRS